MVALAFWANQFVPDLRESWTPSSRVAWRESLCDETSGRRQVWSRVGKFQTLLYGETSMPDGENHSCPRYLLRMFEEVTWWVNLSRGLTVLIPTPKTKSSELFIEDQLKVITTSRKGQSIKKQPCFLLVSTFLRNAITATIWIQHPRPILDECGQLFRFYVDLLGQRSS